MAKLYEQENRITVVVKKEDSGATQQGNKTESAEETSTGGASGGSDTSANNGEKTWRTAIFGSESKHKIKRVIKTNLTHTLAIGKQVLDLAIEYNVAGIQYATGDSAYQDVVERKIEQTTDMTNIASSISMGALYGAWGGPIGSVLGAIMNGVSTGMSISYKYKNREREYAYKIYKEENGIEYKRARANINLTTGRLR